MITNFAKIVQESATATGILVTNINPFMVSATILEIFSRVKSAFPLATLRIEILEKKLTGSLITMLQDIYDPYKVRLMLNQTDLENFSTIDLMAKLKLYKVM